MLKKVPKCPMTPGRAARLDAIGFGWSTADPRHVPWEMRFEELVAFKKKHGKNVRTSVAVLLHRTLLTSPLPTDCCRALVCNLFCICQIFTIIETSNPNTPIHTSAVPISFDVCTIAILLLINSWPF